jgi:hypothetical protein
MENYFFSEKNITLQIRQFVQHLHITPDMMTKKLHNQIQTIISNSMRLVWRKYNVPEVRNRYSDKEFLDKINKKSLSNSVRLYEQYAEQNAPPTSQPKKPTNQYGVPSTSNINPQLFTNPNERFRTPSQQENPSQNLAPPPDSGSAYASWDSNFTGQFSQANGEYGSQPHGIGMGQNHDQNLTKKSAHSDELLHRMARFKDERESSFPQHQAPPDPTNQGQVAEWLGLNRDTNKNQFTQPSGGSYNPNQYNQQQQMGGGGGNGYNPNQYGQQQQYPQQGGNNYGVNNYHSNQFNQQQGMQGHNGNWNNQQQMPPQQQNGYDQSFNPASENGGTFYEDAFRDPKNQQQSGWDNQNSELSQMYQNPPDRMKSAIDFNKDWESKKKAELQQQFDIPQNQGKFDPTVSPNQQFQQQQSQQQSNNFFFAK